MKNKPVIGIDINEILRARWIQFDKYYVEEFGEENLPPEGEEYVWDFFEGYHWEDIEREETYFNEDLPDDINPLDYQLDENGESKIDAFAFEKKIVKLTAKELYNEFMYENFNFEIHGSAPKMYPNVDRDAEKFYMKFKDEFEIILFSKENWFSIQPTLFFLSKLSPRFQTYFFAKDNSEIFDKVDIILTTDPELLVAPETHGVKPIKFSRPYNTEIDCDFEVLNIYDLIDNKEFEQYLGYGRIDAN